MGVKKRIRRCGIAFRLQTMQHQILAGTSDKIASFSYQSDEESHVPLNYCFAQFLQPKKKKNDVVTLPHVLALKIMMSLV